MGVFGNDAGYEEDEGVNVQMCKYADVNEKMIK